MTEVVLFVDDLPAVRYCRICHEEESESSNNLEAPCACSGTVKFAHRDCIQRWCNEKGNTTCEICLQAFEPGYTATSKKKPPPRETTVTIRDSLQAARREAESHDERFASVAENHFSRCGAARLRSFAFTITLMLLLKHLVDVVMGGDEAEHYPFPLITMFILGAIGIIIPMYILERTVTALQNSIIKRQYHEVAPSRPLTAI